MKSRHGRSLTDVLGSLDDEPSTNLTERRQMPPEPLEPPHGATPAVVPVNVLVTPRDRKRLRQLSLDTDTSLQRLGHQAWNMLLASRGLETLEPVTANVPSGRSRKP